MGGQNLPQLYPIGIITIRYGHTGFTCTTGTSNPVGIGILTFGHIIIDNMANRRNINAACGDISGNQNIDLTSPEFVQHLAAQKLPHITMQGIYLEPNLS